MPDPRFDVVVAGGGPAGASTARRLARDGFAVAVLEARRFPRPKPCGEFMSPECLPLLRDLDVADDVRSLGAREVRGMLLHAAGRRALGRFVDVGRAHAPFDHGWAVRRERFDEVLLRAAEASGAIVIEDARVASLVRDGDGRVRGVIARRSDGSELTLRASWIIGADGLRSRVARELGVRREVPWLQKIALTTRYADVEWGEHAEAYLFDGGFFAAAPVDGGLVSVNLVLERELYARERVPRDEVLETWLERVPIFGARIARGRRADPVRGLGPLASRTTRQTFDGAALVGDACGYVDPVTGEGIYFALKGGEMLASSVARALHARRTDVGALDDYVRGRRAELAPRLAFAQLLQVGLKHPAIVRAAARVVAARPHLADLLVSVAGDYVPMRELLRPRVWWTALSRRGGAA